MSSERQDVSLDPAVDAIMDDAKRRSTERSMSPKQRERAKRKAKRKKVTYEIDPILVDLIQQVADPLQVSASSVTNRFLFDALKRYAVGEIDFDGYLIPSRGPRYEWTVMLNTTGLRDAVMNTLSPFQV